LLIRTDAHNPDFINLVKLLDADLAIRDGEDHAFYAQFNSIEHIKHIVVAYKNDKPVSCGAIKEFSPDTVEVKRMFTIPEYRGRGIAALILKELEQWAEELSYKKCILETGKKQPEAIRVYEKHGYNRTPN